MTDVICFDGKVVLVTGGTRGIGQRIATRFAEAGAIVAVCGRVAPAMNGILPAVRFITCDVRRPEQVKAMVDNLVGETGRLDVVVNNAGGSPNVEAACASPRFSESIISLNLLAPLYVAQAANAIMQEQVEGGSIINIASVSGTRPSPGTAAYGAAKAGLLNLTQSLAMEWGPKVRVNAIVAGLIATEMAGDHYGSSTGVARISAMLPLQRMGTPDDIADAALYLASPLASYVSGAQLSVHGGGERPQFLALAAGRAG